MMKEIKSLWKFAAILIIGVLLTTAVPLSIVSKAEASPATIYVPDNYSTIQAAVNAASPGDTIIVRDGTYTENINISKDNLTIQSENGAETTIVQAPDGNNHMFEIHANYVEISGLTVKGAPGYSSLYTNATATMGQAGVYLNEAHYCSIYKDVLLNSDLGVLIVSSSNNVIRSCHLSGEGLGYGGGIYATGATGNNIIQDNFVESFWHALWFHGSNGNLIKGNTITNTSFNICWDGPSINNICFLNNFMALYPAAYLSIPNFWNTPQKVTYIYKGNTYTNYLGNHWLYVGTDANNDGVGDAPYLFYGVWDTPQTVDQDNYPLLEPFENYLIGATPALKVCIDPGHDPAKKPLEYAINKGVADKLKFKFGAKGIVIYLTNPDDDISARISYVNTLKPDVFVSLHCNALEGFRNGTPIGTVQGSEVWIYDDADSKEQAIKELDLAVRTVGGLSKGVDSKLRKPCEKLPLGVKEKCSPWPGGIPILCSVTVCPAVLLEMEFYDYGKPVAYKGVNYSNMLELMNTDVWQEDAAQGIADGILGYFQRMGLIITAYSPVDILVVDPNGLKINKQLNEIVGATYSEIDLDGDGDLDDQISIPDRKIGDYIITLIPEPSALPADTYSLEVLGGGKAIVLAKDVQIADIPSQPYKIQSTESGINAAPIANAGPDQTVYVTPPATTAEVTLDGSASYDPDGDPLTYNWTWDGKVAHGVNPTIELPLGTTTITLVVNDGKVNSEPDTVDITVKQRAAPPVGGEAYPINKVAILAPWVALLAAIIVGTTIFVRRRRV